MNITKRDVAIAIVSGILGIVGGAGFVASTKTAQLADDVHEVKQDYDKSKHRVAEDYIHTADKVREAVDRVDTAEIGSATTTGVKTLGREAADGAREVGSLLKQRLKERLAKKQAEQETEYDETKEDHH